MKPYHFSVITAAHLHLKNTWLSLFSIHYSTH